MSNGQHAELSNRGLPVRILPISSFGTHQLMVTLLKITYFIASMIGEVGDKKAVHK